MQTLFVGLLPEHVCQRPLLQEVLSFHLRGCSRLECDCCGIIRQSLRRGHHCLIMDEMAMITLCPTLLEGCTSSVI